MSFLVYLFVLVVAACSVVFGLDWMQAPLQPPSYAERPAQAGSPAAPAAKPAGPAVQAAARSASTALQPASETTATAAAGSTDGTGNAHAEAPQETKTAATPLCDIAACEHAYRSFTPADCTYQPFEGARRLCTRGNPPRRHGALLAAADAHAQARCNVSACASAYQSFDAATCTYQPYDGPRRLCTK